MGRVVQYLLCNFVLTVRMASPEKQDVCVPTTSSQPHVLASSSPKRPRGFEFLSTDEETVVPPPAPREASQGTRLRDVLGSDVEGWSLEPFVAST